METRHCKLFAILCEKDEKQLHLAIKSMETCFYQREALSSQWIIKK